MPLFGTLHLTLLLAIALACVALSFSCRRELVPCRTVRLIVGWALVGNELVWWAFRYSHEGLHVWNLPFQLCDVTLWMSALACLTLSAPVVEFAYFAGAPYEPKLSSRTRLVRVRRGGVTAPSHCDQMRV